MFVTPASDALLSWQGFRTCYVGLRTFLHQSIVCLALEPLCLFSVSDLREINVVAAQDMAQDQINPREGTLRLSLIFVLAFGATLILAGRSFAADADAGQTVANRWCASCHVVSPSPAKGSDAVPSFALIAKRANFDAAKLRELLLSPHPPMPNMALSRSQMDDITAYILSLPR
jgi:mono/diheme cytochrome c family protein